MPQKANDVEVSFFSNGVDLDGKLFPQSLWRDLARAGLKAVCLSAHVKSRGVLQRHVEDIVPVLYTFQPKREQLHDWAGQVKLEKLKPRGAPSTASGPCDYETQNIFVVRWDGVLTACCYDIEGGGLGDISQVLQNGFEFKRIPLCSQCTLGRGDGEWLARPPLISASYEARLSDRIDLNRPDLPSVLRGIMGLSFMEDWGRWSDANISEAVQFHFISDLPEIFDLVIHYWAFGPNVGKPILVRCGQFTASFVGSGARETVRIRLRPLTRARAITITPPLSGKSGGFGQEQRPAASWYCAHFRENRRITTGLTSLYPE